MCWRYACYTIKVYVIYCMLSTLNSVQTLSRVYRVNRTLSCSELNFRQACQIILECKNNSTYLNLFCVYIYVCTSNAGLPRVTGINSYVLTICTRIPSWIQRGLWNTDYVAVQLKYKYIIYHEILQHIMKHTCSNASQFVPQWSNCWAVLPPTNNVGDAFKTESCKCCISAFDRIAVGGQ